MNDSLSTGSIVAMIIYDRVLHTIDSRKAA